MGFKMKKATRFVVRGSGLFPFDMLRYSRCWPDTEQDSRRFAEDGERSICLCSHNPDAAAPLRWESHGWQVVAS